MIPNISAGPVCDRYAITRRHIGIRRVPIQLTCTAGTKHRRFAGGIQSRSVRPKQERTMTFPVLCNQIYHIMIIPDR